MGVRLKNNFKENTRLFWREVSIIKGVFSKDGEILTDQPHVMFGNSTRRFMTVMTPQSQVIVKR